MTEFVAFFALAAFVENAVFARALMGERGWPSRCGLVKTGVFMAMVTMLTLVTSVAAWAVGLIALPGPVRRFSDMLFCFLVLLPLYLLVYHLLRWLLRPDRFERVAEALPRAAFCAVTVGTFLLIREGGYSLIQSIAYGTGAGVGFALAVVLIAWGDRRLRLSRLPEPFGGLPALLLYIGILSMAFYGLVGHPLTF